MNELFADGGVIGHNPSSIGGTWAFRILTDGIVTVEESGCVSPFVANMPAITNNLTEMLAVLYGLEMLPKDWIGTVCSDSQITLGRIFMGWKWTGIPMWAHKRFQDVRLRLKNWEKIQYLRLDGHPTKAQLESGIGKRGGPVSIHNKWADDACQSAAKKFLKEREEIPF